MKKIQSIWLLLLILFLNCTEFGDEDDSINYTQEPIPWPSLADSPWPMFHGDPQSTGRFNGIGPQIGEKNIFFTTVDGSNFGSVVIGHSNRVIFASSYNHDEGTGVCWLYCLDSKGELLWRTNILNGFAYGEIHSAPTVTSDSLIIIPSPDGNVYCIDENTGDIEWTTYIGEYLYTSPGISKEGTIIVYQNNSLLNQNNLFALDIDGSILWTIPVNIFTSMSFSPDGETLYLSGPVAYNLNGEELWREELYQNVYPCVDNDGNIFGISGMLNQVVSWDAMGYIRWVISGDSLGIDQFDGTIAPTIDINGNLLVIGNVSNTNNDDPPESYLIKINNNGEQINVIPLEIDPSGVGSHLVSDLEGTVYVSGFYTGSDLVAVRSDGSEKWRIPNEDFGTYGSPAFNSNGELFILPMWDESPVNLRKIE